MRLAKYGYSGRQDCSQLRRCYDTPRVLGIGPCSAGEGQASTGEPKVLCPITLEVALPRLANRTILTNSLSAEMPNDDLSSIEEMVIAEINGVFESIGSVLLSRKPGGLSDEDTRAMLQCWASVVQRQGLILARMAILPWRKAELKSSMSGIVNRAPAWMNAHFRGERTMTLELFAEGIAQTMARQQVEINRVLVEQVDEPAPLQALLAEAPLPADPEKVARGELLSAITKAMTTHTEALVGIAADLDVKSRQHFGLDSSEP